MLQPERRGCRVFEVGIARLWKEKWPAAPSSLVFENNVQGVNDAWNVPKDGQKDVDQEVCAAATFKENSERWEDDRNDDLDDVGSGERHFEDSIAIFGLMW